MINSHAEIGEEKRIAKILPKAEKLEEMGIKKIGYGIENYFPNKLPEFQGNLNTPVKNWLKEMQKSGIEIVIFGYDYRQNDIFMEDRDSQNIEKSIVYQESKPEDLRHSFAQSKNGKRYLFDKENKQMEKIIAGRSLEMTNEEKLEFISDLKKEFPDYNFEQF